MNKTKTTLYIIILLLTAFALFAFVKFSDGIFQLDSKADALHSVDDLQNELIADGCNLFWIGDVPEKISNSGITINRVPVYNVSYDTLPFKLIPRETETMDADGLKTTEITLEAGYCPPNSIIVINEVADLTSDDYSLIIRSQSEAEVPIYIIGEDAVYAFREYLFLPNGASNSGWSMKYTAEDGAEVGVLDKAPSKTLGDTLTITALYKELLSNMTVASTEESIPVG